MSYAILMVLLYPKDAYFDVYLGVQTACTGN